MKSFNNYITEKFKISKDIGTSEDFKKDDPILRIWLNNFVLKNHMKRHEMYIGFSSSINYLVYFNSFTKGRAITFSYVSDYGKKVEKDAYSWEEGNGKINKYNIYEYHSKSDSSEITSIYLNKEKALNFLENINFDINNITDSVLNNYFEQIPKDFDIKQALSSYIIKNQNERLKQIYTELKNDKS